MAESAILSMLNATPQEQAALRQIAMLREQGIDDATIFGGLADPAFTQGGGYGYLPYITDLAGISSSYNLGRGNIALQAQADEYQRQGNPYNVVTALQQMRDTGSSAILTDPTLANVQPGPASIYSDYIKGLFDEKDGPAVAATTGTVANTQNPIADANLQAVQRVRNEVGDAAAMQGFTQLQNAGAAAMSQPYTTPPIYAAREGISGSSDPIAQTTPQVAGSVGGQPVAAPTRTGAPVPTTAAPQLGANGATGGTIGIGPDWGQNLMRIAQQYQHPQAAPNQSQPGTPQAMNTGAQSAAARLLSGTIRPGQPFQNPFQERLAAGQIPGFNSINQRNFGQLSPDQQASYMGLVASTGRVSDPMQAYNAYLRTYDQGGSQGARTYR